MAKNTERRVVAELGRPETPEEEAARKAEQSRLYRDRKTLRNLLYALLVSVGLVAAIVILVPRSEESLLQPVDYAQVAASAQNAVPVPLAVPELPEGWSANAAELRTATADQVVSWYIGLISPDNQYVGLTQALNANPSWVSEQVNRGIPSGTVDIDGVSWTVYDNRATAAGGTDLGNVEYALTAEAGPTTYIVFGTASDSEIAEVAASITGNLRDQPATAPAEDTTEDNG
ncbi:DUF4245 domain-containing protein [Herbiconiux sp. KACC 21604]|uniref:DUF4245 domain-containing protein n=1 Tax=unclassified Herbiconiux TaxID=2618217 RepID=UPI0014920BFA|nr:DUF4245 domain-containing protein [Herbiconiux sp. SALV-R1]QJU53970.1 DUF4245 domain-containing protein [Herbiconiux sp. SALV-R1]WPO84998.1 DUF4245 domain-containing protein [Herbiconiux sp. KACC 21604]